MSLSIASASYTDRNASVVSDVTRIRFYTDDSLVSVSLKIGDSEIYSSTLAAYDGVVTLEGVDVMLSDFMRLRKMSRASLKVFAENCSKSSETVSQTISLVFCSYALPPDFNIYKAFFSVLDPQRVPPTANLQVFSCCSQGDLVEFRVSGRNVAGKPVSAELTHVAHDGYIDVDIAAIVGQAKAKSSIYTATQVSMVCHDISKEFFICDYRSFLEFRFRNCFNVFETVYVSGKSEMVTEVDRESAVCSGQLMPYDVRVTRSYEHVTGPLTRMEAAAMSQLAEAEDITVNIDGVEYPVMITDHECKVSDDDSTINTMKFTWRFTDTRPRLFGDTLSPLLPSSGIFTEPFTEPFQ